MKDEDEDGDVLPPENKLEDFECDDELRCGCLQEINSDSLLFFFLPQISRILYRRHGWGYLIIILINHHP